MASLMNRCLKMAPRWHMTDTPINPIVSKTTSYYDTSCRYEASTGIGHSNAFFGKTATSITSGCSQSNQTYASSATSQQSFTMGIRGSGCRVPF